MARPKKHANEKRSERYNLRFTIAEVEHLRQQADAALAHCRMVSRAQ